MNFYLATFDAVFVQNLPLRGIKNQCKISNHGLRMTSNTNPHIVGTNANIDNRKHALVCNDSGQILPLARVRMNITGPINRQINRRADRQTYTQTDRQVDRQTDRETPTLILYEQTLTLSGSVHFQILPRTMCRRFCSKTPSARDRQTSRQTDR